MLQPFVLIRATFCYSIQLRKIFEKETKKDKSPEKEPIQNQHDSTIF
jgi:hypothetical protein